MTISRSSSASLKRRKNLQAEGLQKLGLDANPGLVVELADPQLKKVVWWGVGEDPLTEDHDKDLPMIQRTIATMFNKYPPPSKTGELTARLASCVIGDALLYATVVHTVTNRTSQVYYFSCLPAPFQSMMFTSFQGFLRSSN